MLATNNRSMKYNLIFFTIDAFRHDHFLEKYLPNIVKFSKNAFIFNNAFANGPWTPPSFNSIMTSTYPFMYKDYSPLPKQKVTITEKLKEKGYSTLCINSNTYTSGFFNFDRGFDEYIEIGEMGTLFKIMVAARDFIARFIPKSGKILRIFDILDKVNDSKDTASMMKLNADDILKRARLWMKQVRGNFFAWTHFMDSHSPYNVPDKYVKGINPDMSPKRITMLNRIHRMLNRTSEHEPLKRRSPAVEELMDLYRAALLFIDDEFRKHVNYLKNAGFLENTIIMITGDHGELFMEHGFIEHPARMYDELLHVPLVLYLPPSLQARFGNPRTIERHIDLLHIAPTLLDVMGIESPDSFVGRSLAPLFHGEGETSYFPIISQTYKKKNNRKTIESSNVDQLIAIRTKKWKYIHDTAGPEHCMLFRLEPEINEDLNLVEEMRDVAGFFKERAEAILKNDYNMESGGREKLKIYKAIRKTKL
ncbi:MAG: sulfatase [Candidatus Hodarchaeota archaeon]